MARNPIWAFLRKVARDVDDQVWNRSGPHGAAELGAALNSGNGNGYVMYGSGGRHDDGKKEAEPPQRAAGRDDPEPQQERGGRTR